MPAPAFTATTPPPRVAVVMSVYNGEPYLEAAVRSVLDQTFTDFELVAVDDGSTDGSRAILDRLAADDPRVRVLGRPNTGVAGARNDGLAHTRAPLIACLDADDLAHPTRLEKQIAHLDAHPDVGLLATGFRRIGADGAATPAHPHERDVWARDHGVLARLLAGGRNCIVHSSVVFRRAAFDAAGGRYDRRFAVAHDFELWLRMSEHTRLACLPEVLTDYRVHADSLCARRGPESITDVERAVRGHWRRVGAPPVEDRLAVYRELVRVARAARAPDTARALCWRALRAAPDYRNILRHAATLSAGAGGAGPDRPELGAPRVSVVMPVYNAAPFLEAAVRSILNQTLRDLELVAVDDGSTDGSSAILDRLADEDPRLHVVRRPNTGITRALNDGLAAARAPLIARMDADDLAHPARLQKQADHLDAHPDIGLLGCAWTTCPADGRRIPPDPHLLKVWAAGPDAVAARLHEGHNVIAHPTAVFRRSAFEAAGGHYNPAYETAEDYELWLRMSRVTRLAALPEPLLDYRVHTQSICATRGHESIDAVRRALHAHWGQVGSPSRTDRSKVHQHLATLYHSVRDRRGALREGRDALKAAPHRPGTWLWCVKHAVRVAKGPSY